jgi:hypothetical protein
MFKQKKMHSQALDGVVDKVHTLIANQGEWATKLHKNKFTHESCYDCCIVYPQCLNLHPLDSIVMTFFILHFKIREFTW